MVKLLAILLGFVAINVGLFYSLNKVASMLGLLNRTHAVRVTGRPKETSRETGTYLPVGTGQATSEQYLMNIGLLNQATPFASRVGHQDSHDGIASLLSR